MERGNGQEWSGGGDGVCRVDTDGARYTEAAGRWCAVVAAGNERSLLLTVVQ